MYECEKDQRCRCQYCYSCVNVLLKVWMLQNLC